MCYAHSYHGPIHAQGRDNAKRKKYWPTALPRYRAGQFVAHRKTCALCSAVMARHSPLQRQPQRRSALPLASDGQPKIRLAHHFLRPINKTHTDHQAEARHMTCICIRPSTAPAVVRHQDPLCRQLALSPLSATRAPRRPPRASPGSGHRDTQRGSPGGSQPPRVGLLDHPQHCSCSTGAPRVDHQCWHRFSHVQPPDTDVTPRSCTVLTPYKHHNSLTHHSLFAKSSNSRTPASALPRLASDTELITYSSISDRLCRCSK